MDKVTQKKPGKESLPQADAPINVTGSPKPMRYQWLPLVGMFTLAAFLMMLVIDGIGARSATTAGATLSPTIGAMVKRTIPELGITLDTPDSWRPPAIRDANSFVLSPTGSTQTGSTDGPFMYVVVDALNIFKNQLTFRADLSDPVEQLNALRDAINRDNARFGDAVPLSNTRYPSAQARGYERGNTEVMILMHTGDGRWIYVGLQASDEQMAWYENTVFVPAINSLALAPKKP